MSNPLSYNVNNNHPLITNSQDYALIKKYVSIHSEDRDFLKYPNASQFEIELPEDLLNVSTVKVSDWQLPLTFNVFSKFYSNITMTFKINNPINPSTFGPSSALENAIYEALNNNKDNNYSITIQEGTYSGNDLSNELTNRFNESVTNYIVEYFNTHGYASFVPSFTTSGYTEFVIVYNSVSGTMWFGNKSSGFILTNTTQIPFDYSVPSSKNCNPCKATPATIYSKLPRNAVADNLNCYKKSLPNSYNYGLPYYLGLSSCDMESIEADKVSFYYTNPVDTWLTPTYPGTKVYFVNAYNKCILLAPVYIYLEIEGLNCIDETSPFSISKFTLTTNETNGVVNSALAKLYVPPSNNSWFDKAPSYKFFMPPAERIRKLKLKFRYHNGELVDFNGLPYSILLEFGLFSPQQVRKQNVYNPQTGKN
jgi:hypothetical protein